MKRNVFFVFVLAITITMALCACSKKSDSSKNKNHNDIKMGELGEWAPMPTESKDEWHYGDATVTTTAISTTTKVTTSVTAYVASAKPVSTTTTNTYKGNTTTTLTTSKNDVAKDKSQTNEVTNKFTDRASTSSQLTTQRATQNKQEDATSAVTTKITTNSNSSHTTEATTSSSMPMPKYTPNLYVETSPDILNNTSTQIQESDGEVFQASATLWFQSEESLNNVSDVVDNIDCMKLNVGEDVDYNDFLESNSLKYDDKTEYLASVLLFESSRAAQMQINENTFPELADYYEDSSRLSRNTENLILTNNTKNALVVYVYVNRYSQSITLSWYAVKA